MITEDLVKFKIVKNGSVEIVDGLTKKQIADFVAEKCDIYQSTGMRDKNNELIFDGDKIKATIDFEDIGITTFDAVVHYEAGAYYIVGTDYVCGLGNNLMNVEVVNGKTIQTKH